MREEILLTAESDFEQNNAFCSFDTIITDILSRLLAFNSLNYYSRYQSYFSRSCGGHGYSDGLFIAQAADHDDDFARWAVNRSV